MAATAGPAYIVVKTLAGNEVLRFDNIPPTVGELKVRIAESGYMPVALQKLLHADGLTLCMDDEVLETKFQEMIIVQDTTPQWYWDIEENPSRRELVVDGPIVRCPHLRTDYTNVLTREPINSGVHYFEFHLHKYGDEQWCGLTPDKTMAGPEYSNAVPSKRGWCYYTGRHEGALEALGRRLKSADFVERCSGQVIGMLVDCEVGAVAFDLNGNIQGACEIPKHTALWVLTHLDTPEDHVELRKALLDDAPPAHFEALKSALIDVSRGEVMHRSY